MAGRAAGRSRGAASAPRASASFSSETPSKESRPFLFFSLSSSSRSARFACVAAFYVVEYLGLVIFAGRCRAARLHLYRLRSEHPPLRSHFRRSWPNVFRLLFSIYQVGSVISPFRRGLGMAERPLYLRAARGRSHRGASAARLRAIRTSSTSPPTSSESLPRTHRRRAGHRLRPRVHCGDHDDGVRARRRRRSAGPARPAHPGPRATTSTTASTTTPTRTPTSAPR